MSLFPAKQGNVRNDLRPPPGRGTKSGYPASDSLKPREIKTYDTPNPHPAQVRQPRVPPPSILRDPHAATVEDRTESDDAPAFRYASRQQFEEGKSLPQHQSGVEGNGQSQGPRRRAGTAEVQQNRDADRTTQGDANIGSETHQSASTRSRPTGEEGNVSLSRSRSRQAPTDGPTAAGVASGARRRGQQSTLLDGHDVTNTSRSATPEPFAPRRARAMDPRSRAVEIDEPLMQETFNGSQDNQEGSPASPVIPSTSRIDGRQSVHGPNDGPRGRSARAGHPHAAPANQGLDRSGRPMGNQSTMIGDEQQQRAPPFSARGRSRGPPLTHAQDPFQANSSHPSRRMDPVDGNNHSIHRGNPPPVHNGDHDDQRSTNQYNVTNEQHPARQTERTRVNDPRSLNNPYSTDVSRNRLPPRGQQNQNQQPMDVYSSEMTATQDDPFTPAAPGPGRGRGRLQQPAVRTRSLGPGKATGDDSFSPSAFTDYVNEVKAKNGVLEAQVDELRERCYNAESREGAQAVKVDEYQAQINEISARLNEATVQYHGEISEYRIKLNKTAATYKQMTIASDAYVVLSDQRVERLQTTVTDYIDRIAFLETTIKELQLMIKKLQEVHETGKKAVEQVAVLEKEKEGLQKELEECKEKIEKSEFKIAEVEGSEAKAKEDNVEEAAKQDVDACWKALEGKLSPEKVDSLRHNKASPLQELIGLVDRIHEKQIADAKSLASAQKEAKLHKAANKTSSDLVVGLCKATKVEPPPKDAFNFLELAVNLIKPAIEAQVNEVAETKEDWHTTVQEKIELKKQFETLTNDHKVAMAELQALRAESAKAGNDLEFHKNQAGNVVTLQKIIDKQQDQIDEMKKALEKSKQQEKSTKTEKIAETHARVEAEKLWKQKESELETSNKEKDGKISEKDLTIRELSEEVKKQKDTIAKNNQYKSHGIGVGNSAATAESVFRLKEELAKEKEKHEEQKILERWTAQQLTQAEQALVAKAQDQVRAQEMAEAERVSEAKWSTSKASAANEISRLKKQKQKAQGLIDALTERLGNEDPRTEKDSRASRAMSEGAAAAEATMNRGQNSASAGPSGRPSRSYVNSDDEDSDLLEDVFVKTGKTSVSISKKADVKRKAESIANTEFNKASEHPQIKKTKRTPDQESSGSGTKKSNVRFGNLPSSDPPTLSAEDMEEIAQALLAEEQANQAEGIEDSLTPEPEVQKHSKSPMKRGSSSKAIMLDDGDDMDEDQTFVEPLKTQAPKASSSKVKTKTVPVKKANSRAKSMAPSKH